MRAVADRATTDEPQATAAPERAGATGTRPVGRGIGLGVLFGIPGVIFVFVILMLPLVALILRTAESGVFLASVRKPIVLQALRLSAWTSLLTLGLSIVFGTPLAYGLARARFPGKRLVDTLVDLPIVLPPVVAGVGLLMAFGRRGLLGQRLDAGIPIPATGLHFPSISLAFTSAAVVLAQLFVSAPFFIRAARGGFARVEREVEAAAAIDGATPWQTFRLVTVPLALPALSSGLVLCWARAVGEFGATMMFAGNFIGRTLTMPLAIMGAMESDLYAALALSVLLIALAFGVLLLYRLIGGRRGVEL
jgi:molybdate transport system permease protein